MKKQLLFIMLLALPFACIHSQTTIQLTFTAEVNGNHQTLDSILIENLTQGGDTTLYAPDTLLVLDHGIGISDWFANHGNQIILFPAYPNPVTHTSTIKLWLPQDGPVTLRLFDLLGRELTTFNRALGAGEHSFTFTPGKETYYLLVAEAADHRQVQKLISLKPGDGNSGITYTGHQPAPSAMRKGKSSFPWVPGDDLRFIGFASLGVDTIDDDPVQSTIYTFQFLPPVPPPVADFSVSDTLVHVNDTVYFTDLSTGSPTSWKWFFGDGDSSVLQNPSHIYSITGVYSVMLYASNPVGYDTLNKHHLITVGNGGPGVPCPGIPTITDINGNVYNTVLIGTQCWMKENLKAQNYKNGTTIPYVTSYLNWIGLSTGARCWYTHDSATYAATYGALYNWYAVDNTSGLCPTGWHVPTDLEWQTLEMQLGMTHLQADSTGWRGTIEGGKMKEAGYLHWVLPNTSATNSDGFTALPGGHRSNTTGAFGSAGLGGYWWSSTAGSPTTAWYRLLATNYSNVSRDTPNYKYGFSVRCIMD